MDISAAGLEAPEMDVKNLYYELMAERPEMKYAYDLTVTVREGELTCRLSYMPYKTGAFPEGGCRGGDPLPFGPSYGGREPSGGERGTHSHYGQRFGA